MTVIVCVDDKNGMMFGKRRQSQDKALRDRILEMVGNGRLLMSEYSAGQFEPDNRITVDNNYALHANGDDYCFAEDGDIPLENADRLMIYRWNRRYPADRYFEENPIEAGFSFAQSADFAGVSHERITEEIYIRERRTS